MEKKAEDGEINRNAQGNGSQKKRVRNNSEDMSGTIHRRDDKRMKLTNYAISQMG